jgi:hypothetical protein
MKKKTSPKKWTLFFLLSAKNNLFNEQLKVIQEIYSVGSNKDVDFVILFDAIEGDNSQKFSAPAIYHVNKDEIFYPMLVFINCRHCKGLTTKVTLKNY